MRKDNLNEITEEQKKEAERLNIATTLRNRQLAKTFCFYGCIFNLNEQGTRVCDEGNPYDIGLLVYDAEIHDVNGNLYRGVLNDPVSAFTTPGKSVIRELLGFYMSTHINAIIHDVEVELTGGDTFSLVMSYQRGNKSFHDDAFTFRAIDGPMSFTRLSKMGIPSTDYIVNSTRDKKTFTKCGSTTVARMTDVPPTMMMELMFLTEREYQWCYDNSEAGVVRVNTELESMIGCGNPLLGRSEIQSIIYVMRDYKNRIHTCVNAYDMYFTPTTLTNYTVICEPEYSHIIVDQVNKGIMLAGGSWGVTCTSIKYNTDPNAYSNAHIELYDTNGYTNDEEFESLMTHTNYIGENIFHNTFSDNDNLISIPGNMLAPGAKDYTPHGYICSLGSIRNKIEKDSSGMVIIGYDIEFIPYLFAKSKADAIKRDMKRKFSKDPSKGFIKSQDIYYPYRVSRENDKHDFTIFKSLHKHKVGKKYKYVYKAIVRMLECLTPEETCTMNWPIDDSEQRPKFNDVRKEINRLCNNRFQCNIKLTHLDKISVLVEDVLDLPRDWSK